jgi:hypothetical protein
MSHQSSAEMAYNYIKKGYETPTITLEMHIKTMKCLKLTSLDKLKYLN